MVRRDLRGIGEDNAMVGTQNWKTESATWIRVRCSNCRTKYLARYGASKGREKCPNCGQPKERGVTGFRIRALLENLRGCDDVRDGEGI